MYIEMKVSGLTIDPFTNMPIVILKDLKGQNTLPIWIGLIEASAIATELEHIVLSRPITHDLMKNILDSLGVKALKIEITDLRDNTFFATIHLQGEDKVHEIDARPSDAIALALRTNCKIFISTEVIEKSRRIEVQKEEKQTDDQKWDQILENLSPEDFGKYKM